MSGIYIEVSRNGEYFVYGIAKFAEVSVVKIVPAVRAAAKDSVAAENRVFYYIAHAAGGVPRGMDNLYIHTCDMQHFPALQKHVRGSRLAFCEAERRQTFIRVDKFVLVERVDIYFRARKLF